METPKANPQPRIRLADARNERKLSQQQVAERLGTTYVNVSRWERGITKPSPYFRRKLSQLFGKTEEELDLAVPSLPNPSAAPIKPSLNTLPSPSNLSSTLPDILGVPASTTSPVGEPIYDPTIPLPPTIHLVGRAQELSKLKQRLCADESVSSVSSASGVRSVALTALNGLPGVGKTALSIAIAHDADIRKYFRDGVLWAGLGPDPNVSSLLSHWSRLLGVSSPEMESLSDQDALAVAIRRAIGDRRMLLVIDDAWSLKDALAFKLGGPNCAHLVTTRYPSIATQIAAGGTLTIHELDKNDSMVLLRLLAPTVVEREAQKAQDLVQTVGGLPLALTLIGNYLRLHAYGGQTRRIDAALARLSDAGERLYIGEPRGPTERHTSLPLDMPLSLKSVIAVTDQQLEPHEQAAFHALAVFPPKPNSFSEEAALAVAACDAATLDKLIDTGLLETSDVNHYTLHQTVADYARSCLEDDAPYERLITYVIRLVESHRKDYEILEPEETSILAALELAHTQGKGAELMRCVYAFTPYLRSRGLYIQAENHLQRAYEAAANQRDQHGMASALLYLGEIAQNRGNFEEAKIYLQQGLNLTRTIGDRERTSGFLKLLGSIAIDKGDYSLAETYLKDGLSLASQVGNREQMSALFMNLGVTAGSQGNYIQAEEYFHEGLTLARQIGDLEQICVLLMNLGSTAGLQGNYAPAKEYYQEGLTLARRIGHRERTIDLLCNLGDTLIEQENYIQAEKYLQEGLILASEIGHREGTSLILINLGITERKQGNYILAQEYLQKSITIAQQIGIAHITANTLYEYGNLSLNQEQIEAAKTSFQEMLSTIPEGSQDLMALAYYGLARVANVQHNYEDAHRLGKLSATTLEKMGNRKAQEVRQWLDSLNSMN